MRSEGEPLQRYKRCGLLGGLGVGLLSGIFIGGPNFHTWPVSTVLYVIVGSSVIGALMGCLAIAIIVGTQIRGTSPYFCALDSDHSFDDQIGHADASDHSSLGSHGGEDSGSA